MKRFYANETPSPEPWEAEHTALVREAAARGLVLLENNDALPLKEGSKVALYGYGARNTAYCGYGAASINSRRWVSIERGMEENGLKVTTKAYLSRYEEAMQEEDEAYFRSIRSIGGTLFDRLVKMYSEQFTPVCQIPITEKDVVDSDTDIAVFVITRVSGEGADRKPVPGDYLLSREEKENLTFLSGHYRKVIVLLNTVGVIDTAFLRSLPNLGAILFVGLNGGVTGNAAADVLTGRVTPEGKLVTTWAKRYEDYPCYDTFGLMDDDVDEEEYREGIYLGYRYFDSFGITPAYPFGYGLSYTEFSLGAGTASLNGSKLSIELPVTNCGKVFSGREVVQIYVSCPQGRLNQPAQKLAGFHKTGLLAPGQTEQIRVEAELRHLASYDESTDCWILEQGDYILRAGNSSRNTVPVAVLRVEADAVLEQCRSFEALCGDVRELRPAPDASIFHGEVLPNTLPVLYLSAELPMQTHSYAVREQQTAVFDEDAFIKRCREASYDFQMLLRGECTPEEMAASLTKEELAFVCVGMLPESDSGTAGGTLTCASDGTGPDMDGEVPLEVVVGASYGTAALLETRKMPNISMADGGCGIRLLPEYEMDEHGKLLTAGISALKNGERLMNEQERAFYAKAPKGKRYYQYTTALPMETVMAQTWDLQCVYDCARMEHREMERFGLRVWLAPGMNLHRNPLGGRNFEYFSEDPLITGLCAASVIDGIQQGGRAAATIKHLACNNQEENRGGMNARISQRALREVYLKGYQIAVQAAHPMAIMTGHNLVNGVNAAESYDLLTTAAREEWGFNGLVMTDWGTTNKTGEKRKYGPSDCDTCIRAGTDLMMPGSRTDVEEILTALERGGLLLRDLRWCASNVLRVYRDVVKTNRY